MFRKLTQHVLRARMCAFLVGLAGCASLPQPHDNGALQREAMAGTHAPVPAPLPASVLDRLRQNIQRRRAAATHQGVP